jgi:sugar phosphate isomerase/epimerase
MAMLIVSLPHLTMLDATPPQVVRAAAAAGFDAVCLRLFPTMQAEQQHPLIGDTPMMRETLSLLADTGLKVLDIEAIWLKPETVPGSYVAGFEAAARLGAQVIQTIGSDSDESRMTDTYAGLCEAAAPFGLTVDLEFMAFASTNTLEKTRRIVANSGASNGGLLIDCLHINRCDARIDDFLGVDPRLMHVFQLCDGDAVAPVGREALIHEARFSRRLPGDGVFDLDAIWAVMPPHVQVSIEAPFGDARGKLPFAERAALLKAGADSFLNRAGAPGRRR